MEFMLLVCSCKDILDQLEIRTAQKVFMQMVSWKSRAWQKVADVLRAQIYFENLLSTHGLNTMNIILLAKPEDCFSNQQTGDTASDKWTRKLQKHSGMFRGKKCLH